MKETRRFEIKKKIFTKADLLNIGILFLNEYKFAQEVGNHSLLTFQIYCSDGTSYESKSIDIFDVGGILDLKRLISLEITFLNYNVGSFINISFIHGGGYRDCFVVRGDDRYWVNGVFTRLREIIDSIKPQDNWVLRHKSLFLHLIALGIGTIINAVLGYILFQHIEPIKNPSRIVETIRSFIDSKPYIRYLINWFITWLMGIPWAPYISNWLLKLWPDIEFDFGPEHMKAEKLRRIRISIVLSIAIIPILVSAGYDLFKYFLLN